MDNKNFAELSSELSTQNAQKALIENNITVMIANTGQEAKQMVYELIPEGAEVMTASSKTVSSLGLVEELDESGKYKSVKSELKKLNKETDFDKMQKLGAAPEYIIGSVHAVTEDGKVMIASNTGSQLPGYSYGSSHVIWVVSTKKIVKNMEEGLRRIYEHVLPLEDARLKSVYGPDVSSHVRKLLIVNSELSPSRTTLIFVKEDLGF